MSRDGRPPSFLLLCVFYLFYSFLGDLTAKSESGGARPVEGHVRTAQNNRGRRPSEYLRRSTSVKYNHKSTPVKDEILFIVVLLCLLCPCLSEVFHLLVSPGTAFCHGKTIVDRYSITVAATWSQERDRKSVAAVLVISWGSLGPMGNGPGSTPSTRIRRLSKP